MPVLVSSGRVHVGGAGVGRDRHVPAAEDGLEARGGARQEQHRQQGATHARLQGRQERSVTYVLT